MRLEPLREGPSARILYSGPYSEEGPTIRELHELMADQGHEMRGKHHEIYLGDPRRTAPEKLKTVIRQPFAWSRSPQARALPDAAAGGSRVPR
ncbi:GyrI-like domain-containing protein [Rubrobacter marinus]|uniref:GyrI-like domain-containing protein n=1 Tax=Rubrobacter marinus TaxID=2653852 RepID=UPI001A9F68E6